MTRIISLFVFSCVLVAVEVPPTERAFRFLVVGEDGKPADKVPFYWCSEIEDGINAFGGRQGKNMARKVLLSGSDGVVDIPKHQFSTIIVEINNAELTASTVWMLDGKTRSQYFSWDVYSIDNPSARSNGPPTPGFDAVFKVLSKKGISNLVRYNTSHKQVPCDGTPTPLRVLGSVMGKWSAEVKNSDETDVVITITRPDQEIYAKDSGRPEIAKPLRVPWTLESKTLRFAHFAPDTDLSADYRLRTWAQRLEVQPTYPDNDKAIQGSQELRLWALISGEKSLVVPVSCRIGLSLDSRRLGKAVYSVNFEVFVPLAPCTRYHPDLLSRSHYHDLAPEITGEAIAKLMNPIRAAALAHPFPADMTTTPVLRYDTNPIPQRDWSTLPVLLPSDKP